MPSFVAHKLQVGCTCVDDVLLLDTDEFDSIGLTSLDRKRLVRAINMESKCLRLFRLYSPTCLSEETASATRRFYFARPLTPSFPEGSGFPIRET